MSPSPTLRTDRCVLQPWAEADVQPLWRLLREPSVRQYLLDDTLVDPNWVADHVAQSQARFASGELGLWTIRQNGPALLGFVGFLPTHEPPRLELLYGLAPHATGQGLASETAQAAIDEWRRIGRDDVHASIDAPNQASARVLARLGFRETGRSHGGPSPHEQVHFVLCRQT